MTSLKLPPGPAGIILISQRLQLFWDWRRFASGELRAEWFRRYPHLFDDDDFRRASNRTKPYFFYEWLGAILLHHATGYSALVTKYQQDARKRALLPQILPAAVVNVLEDRASFGKTEGPDLLMYDP